MLSDYIKQFGKELNMEEMISFSEEGHYTLPLDEEINIETFQIAEGTYFFLGTLGPCPEQKAEDFLLSLSQANLFGGGTRGAVIGLNEEENLLTLCLEVGYNISYNEWKNRIEDLFSVITYWRKEALNYQ